MKASRRTASVISFALFLIGIGIITYTEYWWPGIMLVIGLPLAFKQYLTGRKYDMFISLFIFLGVFITVQFNIPWKYLLPTLFTVGGLYILFREFLMTAPTESEKEEDLNEEIRDKDKDKD
ncbi:MAG: hypothetical protein COT84_00665 [Chlamydiae bacterium CG10_big_fil_rev_8_21_14_0_10_35_9]|nr:MAG: hypothetical protein COT84_00665 [Chlamydiae bacterium CG10_big_fil_rev_8_21_14_0_10_35_9]